MDEQLLLSDVKREVRRSRQSQTHLRGRANVQKERKPLKLARVSGETCRRCLLASGVLETGESVFKAPKGKMCGCLKFYSEFSFSSGNGENKETTKSERY